MNYLRDYHRLFRTVKRRVDQLKEGDLLVEEDGLVLVGSVTKKPDGTYEVLDHYESGFGNNQADDEFEIIDPDILAPGRVEGLCELRRGG